MISQEPQSEIPSGGDDLYHIRFADSGSGGLVFLLDAWDELSAQLKQWQREYRIRFRLSHFGDLENEPSWLPRPKPDPKLMTEEVFQAILRKYNADQVRRYEKLTVNMLTFSLTRDAPNLVVLACNTASAAYSRAMQRLTRRLNYFLKRHQRHYSISLQKVRENQSRVFPIIQESAQALYDHAEVKHDADGTPYIALAFFATQYTVQSGVYQEALHALHAEAYRDRPQEKPELRLYAQAPLLWAKHVNAGIDPQSEEAIRMVRGDVEALLDGTHSQLPPAKPGDITVCGLFCTHYPYLRKQIGEALEQHGQAQTTLLSQGQIFADILLDRVRDYMQRHQTPKRDTQEIAQYEEIRIPIHSLLATGQDEQKERRGQQRPMDHELTPTQEMHFNNVIRTVELFKPELAGTVEIEVSEPIGS